MNSNFSFSSERSFSMGLLEGRVTREWDVDPHADALVRSVTLARDWLLSQQHPDGYWVGELEGDTILESEYILLLAWLGQGQSPVAKQCGEYIRTQQLPTGGWAMYPGGPLEISGSVKAYWALKITGHDPQSPEMQRACQAIRQAGGAEQVNSFTRYYLALLGVISYAQCPAVPPEIVLLPKWCPLNIYEMSAWSRTILIPLSLIWAFQPSKSLPPEQGIRELFLTSPQELPVSMPPAAALDDLKTKSRIDWGAAFRKLDRAWKTAENLRLKPLRKLAIRKAKAWMCERFANSDGLGAIFPPIIWSVIALRCLGYAEDSPEVVAALEELKKLTIVEGATARLEPCRSPVWDTALSVIALREAGVACDAPVLRKAVDWLLSKEVHQPGDWTERMPNVEPGGWYFEFNNGFYPDVDDTIMVTMALAKCLPRNLKIDWQSRLLSIEPETSATKVAARPGVQLTTGTAINARQAMLNLDRAEPMQAAITRAVKWLLAMQCRGGGWGAFDRDNDREILTRVPFADHNAMIDPPTADITARVLEMFGALDCRVSAANDHSAELRPLTLPTQGAMLEHALQFVWTSQETDHAWYGRWGVNYIYGTWQCLVGLTAAGVPATDPRLVAAARWLKEKQQPSGGWGETPRTYDEPQLRGQGPPTASQTAWAIMGLIAAGETHSTAVRRGVDYLLTTQLDDGTWDEPEFTGTGFPRVFYLRYHLYRHYFPLMALGRYAVQTETMSKAR